MTALAKARLRPFPYQAKCLQWLRQEHVRLDAQDRNFVNGLLEATGCEALLQKG